MFNSDTDFSSNNDFSYASTSMYLPAQQADLCLGPHSLFGTGRQFYIFRTVLQLLICHRPPLKDDYIFFCIVLQL